MHQPRQQEEEKRKSLQILLDMRHTEFYQDVKRMRELQKQYFKTRRKDVLASSKLFEQKVDRHIHDAENPTLL